METITEINIKGMVCNRCIFTIQEVFSYHGYPISTISLGKVVFSKPVDMGRKDDMKRILSALGFELISDRNEQLLYRIKQSIDEWLVTNENGFKNTRLSDYLSQKFSKNYDSLGEFFSRYEGKTIEKYFIGKRLEIVKEMLVYTDLPLSEIAFRTGFSSAHHLSSQFKKNTGLNPSELRVIREAKIAIAKRVG